MGPWNAPDSHEAETATPLVREARGVATLPAYTV